MWCWISLLFNLPIPRRLFPLACNNKLLGFFFFFAQLFVDLPCATLIEIYLDSSFKLLYLNDCGIYIITCKCFYSSKVWRIHAKCIGQKCPKFRDIKQPSKSCVGNTSVSDAVSDLFLFPLLYEKVLVS